MFDDVGRLLRLGDEARDRRNWPEAREAYAQALQRHPLMDHIWVQYGHALKETRDIQAAEAAYRRALDIAPAIADTHLQLGHLLKIAGRLEEAASAYCKSLELDPGLEDARNELKFLAMDPTRGLAIQEMASSLGLNLAKQLRCVIWGRLEFATHPAFTARRARPKRRTFRAPLCPCRFSSE